MLLPPQPPQWGTNANGELTSRGMIAATTSGLLPNQGMGRGRGATLPAWATQGNASAAHAPVVSSSSAPPAVSADLLNFLSGFS